MTKPVAQPETVALFISDLHLAPAHPKTTQAFFDFMREHAVRAQQLYLLGDLFEVWPGDDDLSDPWNQTIVQAIRAVSETGVQVCWIGGNRDFLLGNKFAQAAGMTLLPDLHVFDIAGQRVMLAHGDAQCTNDRSYIAFRAKTHSPLLQKIFLALPLGLRKAIVNGVRSKSRQSKQSKKLMMMDVAQETIDALFAQTGANVMIHGHTHLPARHDSADGKYRRYVLPDWECEHKPERGGWVEIYSDGSIRRFDIKGRMVTTYPNDQQH
jgi:UDP-2,3-diacylglucosamine hydrolase